MDLFGFGTVIVHFLIISHSYHFICKGQINRKELFVFGAYTLLTEIVFDFPLYILYLDGLGIERFLFPLGLYSYFRWMKQYERDRGLFLSLLLSLLYESTHNFLSVTFSSITGDNFVLQYHFPFFFVVTVLTYFVTLKIIYYFHLELAYFDEDYLYPFLKKVFFALLLLHIVSFVSDMVSTIKHLNSFGSILSSIVFISLLLTFFAMNSHKVQMEKEIALKQKKFEQKHLQNYTDEIVGLYNEIRGFRHDYAGMLVSMQMAIDSGNLQEIDRIYNEVLVKANHKLRSDKYTYFDLNNIEDSALRSLVAQSIVYARNNGVEFTLEVKDTITKLPIELLDLVRIMSVLLNNAVEGSADSYKKQMEVAVIKMETETVIVIQNSCKMTMTPSGDLFALGFSTKGRNRGVGLNNVKELLDKYNNIILETEMEGSTFRQIIRFKREFEVAQLIRHYNPYAIIVFITSRSEFATLTYKYQVSALDFVDKDINDEMFKKRIEQNIFYTKSMLLENEDVVDYFDYNYKGNDLKIPYHDILYIETTGVSHKLRIIGKNFAKEFYGTMTDIQEKDKHTQRFYSPHKSFLVNIGNIREIDRKNLEIVFYEDHRCPISRLKIRKLKDILEKKSQK